MKAFGLYLAACVIAIALVGAIAWGFLSSGGREMLLVSAGLALGVQIAGFAVARMLRQRNLMLGWGLGSVLRLVVLVLYAVLVAKSGQAALAPALLSFVGFLFVTTLFEPVFLRL